VLTSHPAYLTHVLRFLEDNPSDVLTLLITNPEGLLFQNQWAPVFEAANLTGSAYVQPHMPMAYDDWLTLGEMIATNKRLVIFIDFVGNDGTTVDYIIPEFGSVRSIIRFYSPSMYLVDTCWGSRKDMGNAVRCDGCQLPVLDRQDPRAA